MEFSVCQLQSDKLCSHDSFCVVQPLTVFQFATSKIVYGIWSIWRDFWL